MSNDELLGIVVAVLLMLLISSVAETRKDQERQREHIRKLEERVGIRPEERL